MNDAAQILHSYSAASLQTMARQRGLDVKGKPQEQLVGLLAPLLFDRVRIEKTLAGLAPVERLLLDRLILLGGDAPTSLLRRQLEKAGQIDPRRRPGSPGWSYREAEGSPENLGSRKFEDVVARLGALGLVFTIGPQGAAATVELAIPGRRLYTAKPILAQVPGVTLPVETMAAPPAITEADPRALLRDAYVLLAFAGEGFIPLTARDQIGKRALVQIDASFQVREGAAEARTEDELGRLPLLRALLEDLGLLVQRTGGLLLGSQPDQFLSRPPGERQAQLYRAYCRAARWCELFRIDGLKIWGKGGTGRLAPEPVVSARQRVIAEIAELPVGQWISLDHLVDRLKQRAYEFLFPRPGGLPDVHYYGYDYDLRPYDGANPLGWRFKQVTNEASGWDLVEAGFIRVIAEALHWLGIVDLGHTGVALSAFRVTADGARLLRGEALPPVSAAPNVVVQPNFQVFAFDPTGEDVLFNLDQMADRIRVEQVVEYRLTRESVYRAQRRGIEAAEVLAFLDQVSTAPLPQNVRRTLEEWGAQHERITIRSRASLIHVVDAATLDALYADLELSRLLGRRIAPTAALISAANLTTLNDQLLRRDELPALTEGAGVSGQNLLAVDAAGRVSFCKRLPSMYLRRALSDFADEGLDGKMRLTAAGLRRAAKAGLDAEQIVQLLGRFHAGPLPPEVPSAVRRWTKDWGRGALVEAAILQVERVDILADLLADPALKPYLESVPGVPTLALVRGEAVERVREELEARGMELDSRLIR